MVFQEGRLCLIQRVDEQVVMVQHALDALRVPVCPAEGAVRAAGQDVSSMVPRGLTSIRIFTEGWDEAQGQSSCKC